MSALKPGDRALLLPAMRQFCDDGAPTWPTGEIVAVLSGPLPASGQYWAGTSCFFKYICELHGEQRYVGQPRLMRLPPDDECKRLFRETEKPREVPA